MSSETGTRSDVPHHMIYPLKDTRPNLHFVTGVHVKHVTFDECVCLDILISILERLNNFFSARIMRRVSRILSTRCFTPIVQGTHALCEGLSWS